MFVGSYLVFSTGVPACLLAKDGVFVASYPVFNTGVPACLLAKDAAFVANYLVFSTGAPACLLAQDGAFVASYLVFSTKSQLLASFPSLAHAFGVCLISFNPTFRPNNYDLHPTPYLCCPLFDHKDISWQIIFLHLRIFLAQST